MVEGLVPAVPSTGFLAQKGLRQGLVVMVELKQNPVDSEDEALPSLWGMSDFGRAQISPKQSRKILPQVNGLVEGAGVGRQ